MSLSVGIIRTQIFLSNSENNLLIIKFNHMMHAYRCGRNFFKLSELARAEGTLLHFEYEFILP
jgi:hypothetical protein